ncbi:ER degradation-enhancing alpha-mannosidase-like protein 2 [Euwallacea fornicatus]|uniref:ER degradation-enhancing alpha-mannosidase-like protein 2 n=1 Tax=Euwallacea fornicatus TaxID=995702 RepID=UPI00338F7DEA
MALAEIKILLLILALCFFQNIQALRTYTKTDLNNLRDEAKEMFYHAYDSYLKYAYPYDELRPVSCDGIDTYGSYSLTLIDALDTLAIMGNFSEFQRVVELLSTKIDFDTNINVSVFETNIRIIGGLLSAHLLSSKAGAKLEPGYPCNGPLLRLAEDVAKRLIVAFDTKTGMPYGTVNLRHGVPKGETPVTCTAGVGTFIIEFGALSRLTGDPIYEEVAMNALYALFNHRSSIGLFGNHIDTKTGKWTAQDSGIGSGIDSYFEYLVKGSILLQRPELMEMFYEVRKGIEKYMKKDDWYMWVSMVKGQVTLPVFQSLEAYWPGVLSLIGETSKAMRTLHNYHQVWQQYGFTPEFYYITQSEAGTGRESYPLRPEHIESIMYLYRATGDPFLLEAGEDILRSIKHSSRTPCGYATIKDVRDHRKEDRMESFFLAETTKYLYLLFDTDNFIHNQGEHGTLINTPNGECVIDAGGYVFNTEAHPIDPSALHCCHSMPNYNLFDFKEFQKNQHIYRGVHIKDLNKKPLDTPEDSNVTVLVLEALESVDTEANNNAEKSVIVLSEGLESLGNVSSNGEASEIETPQQKGGKLFDPQQMLERFRKENRYPRNRTWEGSYELLSCKAQKFLQRIAVMGEFFN